MYANSFCPTVTPGHTLEFDPLCSGNTLFEFQSTVSTGHKISSSLAFGAWFSKLK